MRIYRCATFLMVFGFLSAAMGSAQELYLTGDAKTDLFAPMRVVTDENVPFEIDRIQFGLRTKSPWLASGMSLLVPGTGEFYSESYVKSAIFFGLEVAGWVVAYAFDQKGDRQTARFEREADNYWSVVRYARWLITHRGANIYIDPDEALPPWRRVNWDDLHLAEREAGSGFSHTLPRHGEQQYYELIGKYYQYTPGWDDFVGGSDFYQVSPRFLSYSAMRGKANDYYNVASTALGLIVVNHILSALDAYFTATRYNNTIRAELRLNSRDTPYGVVMEPMARVSVGLWGD